jgi:hypothetical protein
MSPERMEAVGAILSGQNGGTFYGILAEIIDTFHDPVIAPIDIEIDVEGRRARCAVGDALQTSTEPIQSMGEEASDYSIQVKIPGGFEYDEAEIAMAKVLKGSGPIAFDHQNGHSSLAHIARHPGNKLQLPLILGRLRQARFVPDKLPVPVVRRHVAAINRTVAQRPRFSVAVRLLVARAGRGRRARH